MDWRAEGTCTTHDAICQQKFVCSHWHSEGSPRTISTKCSEVHCIPSAEEIANAVEWRMCTADQCGGMCYQTASIDATVSLQRPHRSRIYVLLTTLHASRVCLLGVLPGVRSRQEHPELTFLSFQCILALAVFTVIHFSASGPMPSDQ